MPRFTPDMDRVRVKLGRPWALFWTTAHWEAITLIHRNGAWEVLESPTDEEVADADYIFDQRNHHVSYETVRELNLPEVGRVLYVDDYDDQWDDVYVCKENTPYLRADHPEPVHTPREP